MTLRKSILFGAGALLFAGTQAAAQIRVSKDRPASVTTTSPGAVETTPLVVTEVTLPVFNLSSYPAMSEPNMLAHMLSGDSLEIEIGRLAQAKGSAQSVRDYGTMLVNDHSGHLAKSLEIITKEGITPEPLANDVEGARMRGMLAWLANAPASASWDAAFLRFQAAHHQNELDIYNLNEKNAHDDDFEAHIGATQVSLTRHRDMARSAASALGISIP
jgi:predicted outer membrane protein